MSTAVVVGSFLALIAYGSTKRDPTGCYGLAFALLIAFAYWFAFIRKSGKRGKQ
jgi:hypothetical protein